METADLDTDLRHLFFLKNYFLTWTIFKVFTEFVTVLFLFYVLVFWPRGMWDLSSPKGMERTPAALKAES